VTTVKFLGDEHIRHSLADAVWHREPVMEFLFVGQAGAPPLSTPDPELLVFAETHKYSLLSSDKKTMPEHVTAHLGAGRHTWGVFLIRPGTNWAALIDDLILIWSASTAEDWQDRLERLPW
jgi:hypothetical protein